MEQYQINPEVMLSAIAKLDKRNAIDAMREFTGIKIIEAVDLLIKDFSDDQKALLLSRIDDVINVVL